MAISPAKQQWRASPEGRQARIAQGERRRARRKAEGKPIGSRSASSTPREHLWRNHGLRPEDLAALIAAQQGACYLCGTELDDGGKGVHVDHDHSCCPQGKSCSLCRRGVACQGCNLSIGLAGDDPARLRRMADALEAAKLSAAARMASGPRQMELGIFDAPD